MHAKISRTPLGASSLHAEGEAFDLGWTGARGEEAPPDVSGLPSVDTALYLIHTVKFRACQLFHLFDEEAFFSHFYAFYENPIDVASEHQLWYVHYLLIIAFGKAFISRGIPTTSSRLPGCEFFVRAMALLPDTTYLCLDEILSSEILTCVALYLQSLDFRGAAHCYVRPPHQSGL